MQITERVRRIKQFLEAMSEELREAEHEGQNIGLEFSFSTAKGDISKSEALSFLNAIVRSASAFDEDMVAQFAFNFQVTHPLQEDVSEKVKKRMQKLVELDSNAKKLVSVP